MTVDLLADITPDRQINRVPCSVDPESWYDPDQEATARRVCAGCPVKTTCLDVALTLDEPWGVWGGFTADERLRLAAGRTAQHCPTCGIEFVPPLAAQVDCDSCIVAALPSNVDQDVLEIAMLAAAGYSDSMIGERLGRNPRTVASCRRRHDIPSLHSLADERPHRTQRPALLGCGTEAAYRRHLRKKETPDEACRRANALDVASKRSRKRAQRVSLPASNEMAA